MIPDQASGIHVGLQDDLTPRRLFVQLVPEETDDGFVKTDMFDIGDKNPSGDSAFRDFLFDDTERDPLLALRKDGFFESGGAEAAATGGAENPLMLGGLQRSESPSEEYAGATSSVFSIGSGGSYLGNDDIDYSMMTREGLSPVHNRSERQQFMAGEEGAVGGVGIDMLPPLLLPPPGSIAEEDGHLGDQRESPRPDPVSSSPVNDPGYIDEGSVANYVLQGFVPTTSRQLSSDPVDSYSVVGMHEETLRTQSDQEIPDQNHVDNLHRASGANTPVSNETVPNDSSITTRIPACSEEMHGEAGACKTAIGDKSASSDDEDDDMLYVAVGLDAKSLTEEASIPPATANTDHAPTNLAQDQGILFLNGAYITPEQVLRNFPAESRAATNDSGRSATIAAAVPSTADIGANDEVPDDARDYVTPNQLSNLPPPQSHGDHAITVDDEHVFDEPSEYMRMGDACQYMRMNGAGNNPEILEPASPGGYVTHEQMANMSRHVNPPFATCNDDMHADTPGDINGDINKVTDDDGDGQQ